MITEEYRELNRQLHADREDYGKSSSGWAPLIVTLCQELRTRDVLDYGCGKAELNLHMPFEIRSYDPSVKKYDAAPEPADIVVCNDVMEHVEPQFTEAVLDNLARLTRHLCILSVATNPAVKVLADGRNAHLVVEPAEWWMPKIEARWTVIDKQVAEEGFFCQLAKKDAVVGS